MTRIEEIVQYLKDELAGNDPEIYLDIDDYKIIVEALEQEPCEDFEVKKIDEWEIQGKNAELWIVKGNLQVRYLGTTHNIPLLPVIPQEPKIGHWEWLTEDKYRCSNCNHETRVDECMNKPMYDFCPFCSAKMESEG